MGREIRRVAPNWEHPKYTSSNTSNQRLIGKHIPLYDKDYETAAENWINNCILWREGKHPDQNNETAKKYKYYWDWDNNPPDAESYRSQKWTPEEAIHYQMYETVSEGTPLTPHFATLDELENYLVNSGDFTGHKWPRAAAHGFCQAGWAPSGMFSLQTGFITAEDERMYQLPESAQ